MSEARRAAGTDNARIAERTLLTEAIGLFRVIPDDVPIPFVPGQYVTVGLTVEATTVQRPYSVASSARRLADGYELYVRLVPDGALTPHLFRARTGDRVSLRRPKGRFTLRDDDERVHLFVATGCGLAPFMSMLRTLDDDGTPRPVILLHGVSYADELGYREEIERLAASPRWSLRYVPTVSRPRDPRNAGWSGRTGRVEVVLPSLISELDLAPTTAVAYVCGNPEMTRAVERILGQAGFGSSPRTEEYWPLPR